MKSIAIDFDGVINSYTSDWTGHFNIPDPPVQGAIEFLHECLQHYDRVYIHSVRARWFWGRWAIRTWLKTHSSKLWYDYVGRGAYGTVFGINNVKITATKPRAKVYIDDRACRFEGEFKRPEEYLEMKPWNRK